MFDKKIKMTPLELEATKNKTFWDGYATGYERGKRDGLSQRLTFNTIREFLGLPIIKTEGEKNND